METLIFLLFTATPRLTSLLVEEQLPFGTPGGTLFPFAHVIILGSLLSVLWSISFILCNNNTILESGKYLTFFYLRLLSEIKPTVSAKQNKQCPHLPMGLAKRHSYFTSCSSSIPEANSSQLQILVN